MQHCSAHAAVQCPWRGGRAHPRFWNHLAEKKKEFCSMFQSHTPSSIPDTLYCQRSSLSSSLCSIATISLMSRITATKNTVS